MPSSLRYLLVFGGLLALMLAAPWLFRLFELRTRRGWRRIGARHGLEVKVGDLTRSLRGAIDGVDLDVVFQRRTDSAQTTVVAAGDSATTSSAASGLVLTGAPLAGTLDPQADGPHLARLRARGRLQLEPHRARWAPRGGARMGPRRLEGALRLFLAAVDEARAAGS